MADKFRLNHDRTVAIDTEVSYYTMDSCPLAVKVQLHTVGGVAIYGIINNPKDVELYKGWRPLPAGAKDVG